MMKTFSLSIVLAFVFSYSSKAQGPDEKSIKAKVDSVLRVMTLDEKIGQLNLLACDFSTGTVLEVVKNYEKEISQGRVGSFLNVDKIEDKIKFQKFAIEQSRMKIPLMFGFDVVHGFKTIFPIPLGEAACFDTDISEKSSRIAAIEASAYGINWAFGPMVDVSRDPRWGRVMEGAGEDTWWGSKVAFAKVKGFQGDNLANNNTIAACPKHFAAYGLVEGGKEYNTVDLSEVVLREVYLPPFKAAVEAGAATIMNGFTTYNRIPVSCSKFLVRDVLKGEWGFKGFVVSDWGSFYEVINHGVAKNNYEAAEKCMNATSDMDMEGHVYINELSNLVKDNKIQVAQIDDAVSRVLRIKFMLGLFDDPYRYFDVNRPKQMLLRPEHLALARDVARKSIVLLKNEKSLLPISKSIKKIAIIGQIANSHGSADYMGTWSAYGNMHDVVNLVDGVKNKVDNATQIKYAEGGKPGGDCTQEMILNAVKVAQKSDLIILSVGENGNMGGENQSRANISLPGNQEELVKAVLATGKPIVCVVFTNRPLTIEWLQNNVPSILLVWHPGTQGGNAIADVLFGDYNPSGKLPITFPRSVGQIPIYYNYLNTGKQDLTQNEQWGSKYIDSPNEPLYPFGFGLSYTTFKYSSLHLSSNRINRSDTLQITVSVKNTGKYAGTETAQLYIRDMVGTVSRPVKELRGIQKVTLQPGESKEVKFTITVNDLKFWNDELKYVSEPGEFKIFVGTNSVDLLQAGFELY